MLLYKKSSSLIQRKLGIVNYLDITRLKKSGYEIFGL